MLSRISSLITCSMRQAPLSADSGETPSTSMKKSVTQTAMAVQHGAGTLTAFVAEVDGAVRSDDKQSQRSQLPHQVIELCPVQLH